MVENKNIYKGLECSCNHFEKIPIHRRDFGTTGVVISNGLVIAENLSIETLDKHLKNNGIENKIRKIPKINIMMNFGILNFLYKKAEGKSNQRTLIELGVETSIGLATTSKLAVKTGVSILTRIGTGAATGAAFGSSIPIAGTVVGAVVGSLIAFGVEYLIFNDTDKEAELHNAEIERLEKEYKLKIDRITDYLVRYHYIELRELTETESEELCKEVSNLKNSYFKTIMLMQSFPNYLDIDKEFYETLQEKALDSKQDLKDKDFKDRDSKEAESKETNKTESKQLQIKPIADSIPLTIEIEKCHNGISGNLLRNTTIYIYNHRFKRVVAKGKSDNNGKLIVHNVYVGKEYTIDKLSFITDRDNFDESNFELSLSQYESFTNIQKKHKSTKELKLLQAYFSFNGLKLSLEYEYEVSNLKANIYKDTIELIPTHNLKDTRFRQYIKYAYMVFDITDSNIDEKTSNITIANRAMLGLKNLGNSGNNKYEIRESWREKIVVFFAYFDKQEKTPFFKALFINKPIVILDLGNSGAIPLEYEQNSMKRVDIVYDIIQMIEARLKNRVTLIKLQKNSDEIMGLDERVRKVNAIKQNTQSKNLLFLSLHIDSEATKSASGMRCFYNDKAYAEQEKRFIKHLKEIYPVTNNTYFENKSNLYLTKFVNVASVLVTLGFISNDDDKARLNNKTQRQIIANKLFLAISNYIHGIK